MNRSDWLLVALLVNAATAVAVIAYACLSRRESWLSPIVQFTLFLELFTLPLPTRALTTMEIEGDVTPHLPEIFPYLAPSVWLVTLSLLVFATCYYLPFVGELASRLPLLQTRPDRSIYLVVAGIILFSLFLIGVLARTAGGILPFILLGYSATAEMYGKGHLAAGFPWLFVGAMFLLVRYALYRRRRDVALFAGVFVVLTIMNVVMGNRNAVLYEGITTAVFWHLAVSRLRFVRLLPLLAIAFVALNIVGQLRSSGFESPRDAFERLVGSFGRAQESGELHHGTFYTLTTGEFVVPFESLPMLMAADADRVPLEFGGTLLTSASLLVPTVLWPERPLPLANWYMQTFYGSGYGLNQGRAFFFLSEGWLNFGPAGVLLVAAIWGMLWGTLGAYVRAERLDPAAALVAALAIAFLQRAIAGDSATMLVALPEQSLLPVMIAFPYLTRLVRRRDRG